METIYLKKFTQEEVLVSKDQAKRILIFFFGKQEPSTKSINVTAADMAFAQALLTEAIDRSKGMGFFQMVFMVHPTLSLNSLIIGFAREAASQWFRNKDVKKDPKIYDTVRDTLALNFKSAWKIRLETDEEVLY